MLMLDLPADLDQALNEISSETKISKAALVEEAIRRQLEDIEDIRIADERLAELEAGRSERISFEEMRRRLGLEG